MTTIPGKHADRRQFLKEAGSFSLAALLAEGRSPIQLAGHFAGGEFASLAGGAVRNRAPLAQSAFNPLPLGTVKPSGWLRTQLEIQAKGLSGHLDETWADVGPNSGWLGGTGESWERGPYYLDGLIPLAWLLDDQRLKAKAQKYIDWTLNSQSSNGMFGPPTNDDWWPRMVMLKALTQYYELTRDERAINLMHKYCLYQLTELPGRPLRDWGKFRWQDNALVALWLYNRNGDAKLLDLVTLLHKQGYDWVGEFSDFKYKERITAEYIKLEEGGGLKDLALATHGVNNGQAIKTGPVWSLVSKAESDRKATARMIAELDRYHGLPNGMFSCDEHLGGLDPSQGSELCTVVEYMYSLEQAMAITGDAGLGDRLERLAFNALPGAISDDMWSHQYDQEPNQVECSLHRKPWTTDGPESNLFGLEPHFGCCTANYHQGWPKFAASLFMQSDEDGLAAMAYSPCEVKISIRGTAVHVIEETEYPFRNTVRIRVNAEKPTAFPLSLRIPAWAGNATVKINGVAQAKPMAGSFAKFDRTWKAGDQVEIDFAAEPRVSTWFNGSAAVEYGALVFSLGIGEDWVKLRDRGLTADWQIYPTTGWNYALAVGAGSETDKSAISVEHSPVGAVPFGAKSVPVKLRLKAAKIPEWRAEDGAANPLPQSPVKSKERFETITLIPYAAAKLRITAFPRLAT